MMLRIHTQAQTQSRIYGLTQGLGTHRRTAQNSSNIHSVSAQQEVTTGVRLKIKSHPIYVIRKDKSFGNVEP